MAPKTPLLKRTRRFLAIFGSPLGAQKSLKIYEHVWVKGSWEPAGSHFGRFSAFFSILAPLLVHSGSILGPPGPFFDKFVSFFDHDFHVFFSSLLPLFHSKTARKRHVKTTIQQDSMTTRQQDSRTATQQPNNPTTNNPTTHQPLDAARRNARSD